MTISLFTTRLHIRDFQLTDVAAYVSLYRDQDYCQYYSEDDCDIDFQCSLAHSFIEKANKHPRQVYTLAICLKDKNEFIGVVSLRLENANLASYGCGISVKFQSKVYATETMYAMLDFAFTDLDIKKIRTQSLKENSAAIRLCEQHGFRLISEKENDKLFRNKQWTTVEYQLAQNE